MLRKKGSQRQYRALAMKANVEFEMQIKTNFFYCRRNIKIYPEIYLTLESPNSNMRFPDSSVGKESACNVGDPSLIPGSGQSTGEVISYPLQYSWASLVAQLVKNLPAMGSVPGLGRSPGEGKGYPQQYSGLENSVEYYTVHGVAKSQTWLSDFHFKFQF